MSPIKNIITATNTTLGITCLWIFCFAYLLVILEEFIHLRKSKPVVVAAGIIWAIIAILAGENNSATVHAAIEQNILEYAQLLLFLLVAMTYTNTMQERGVFHGLRALLLKRNMSYKKLFWVTGFIAFFLSPFVDNLTTALIMGAVITAVGQNNKTFISLSFINIVIAANAGGTFSPFGDLTTLMVWQAKIVKFEEFFRLFIPALISYLIPACAMSFAIPNNKPHATHENYAMRFGAKRIVFLFAITVIISIMFHNYLHLPAALGMMTGLGLLQLFAYYIKIMQMKTVRLSSIMPFDIIKHIESIEWDTLLFFYGIMLAVGGIATLGYLELVSHTMYNDWGQNLPAIYKHLPANTIVGLLSAVIDNIPVMFAILTMRPEMSHGDWLLVTLTTGIGGSLLSIGSAAGVALMGQARGMYTFFSHLKWSPLILLGYLVGVFTHLLINRALF